jgi:hypothetical protein
LDVQFGKITQLLSDLTLRVLNAETKMDSMRGRMDDVVDGKRTQATQMESVQRKLDELSSQLREVKAAIPAAQPSQSQSALGVLSCSVWICV